MFTRIIWALILAPPVLLAIHFGPPYSDLLVGLAAAVTLWEWSRLCSDGKLDAAAWTAIATGVFAVALGTFRLQDLAAWVLAAGAMLVAVLAMRGRRARTLWLFTGVIYLGTACLAFQWLRQQGVEGRNLVYWLLILVWATDSAAYFVGRAIGGPKLAPAISPKKTWAGLIGGMLGAALAGYLVALLLALGPAPALALAGLALAVVAQGGDLFESYLKRYHGAKDSSRLIPGHGGLLDRVDGVLAVVLVVAGLFWVRGGPN